ncbi:MAG: ActS/PrrB/RegB family redox-sensitive histidine kinase [Pseudomonadota bacterium]
MSRPLATLGLWPADRATRFGSGVPVRTLTALRWLAIGGQSAAVLVTHFGLGYNLPLGWCLGLIAASAWVNIFCRLAFSPQRRLNDFEAFTLLAWDILQLAALLFLTGGLKNPFSLLFLAPTSIAATVLSARPAAAIGVLALTAATALAVFHLPFPWRTGETLQLPQLYLVGHWLALSLGVVFAATYAFQIAAERERMRNALSATELVMAREQRLSALGGLAAAAAHELGTPLATIQVTAKEIQREAEASDPALAEDAALLVGQAQRCRSILERLSSHGESGDLMHDTVAAARIIEEAAEPFTDGPKAVEIDAAEAETADQLARRAEVIYGLRNIIENAVDFASETVRIHAVADGEHLSILVEDDGPGFSPEILPRLGEPYVTSRSGRTKRDHPEAEIAGGLGLGFFIAKTLLERSGATVHYENRTDRSGARVGVRWALESLAPAAPAETARDPAPQTRLPHSPAVDPA